MKRLILLSAVVMACVRCAPEPEKIYYGTVWSVKNSTERTLTITPPPYGGTDPHSLAPGAEVNLYSRGEYEYKSYFEMIMICWRGLPETDISFDVLASDGTLLKKWEFTEDNRYYYYNSSVRNFFSPLSWTHSYDHDKRRKKRESWSFEILPGDIEQQTEI